MADKDEIGKPEEKSLKESFFLVDDPGEDLKGWKKHRRKALSKLGQIALLIWPKLKDWETFLKKQWNEVEKVIATIIILIAVVLAGTIYLTFKVVKHYSNSTLSSTNSFYHGTIDMLEKDRGRLQKTLDDNKTDCNEIKRTKDAEIAKLTTEKESALNQVRLLESLPQTALLTYSNVTALGKLYFDTPDYQLEINGKPIDSYTVGQSLIVPLKEDREIAFRISQLKEGEMSVENVTLGFYASLDATNILADARWTPLIPVGTNVYVMEIISQHVLTAKARFDATSFSISTNFSRHIFSARIDISAPRTRGVKSMFVNFTIP